MSLEIATRSVGEVDIIDLNGRITLGESQKLRDIAGGILEKGSKKILLNLGDVSYIDSAGLGDLVSLHSAASKIGASMKLAGIQKQVQTLLRITNLITVFSTHDTEDAALVGFGQPSG